MATLPATVVDAPDCQLNWQVAARSTFDSGDLKATARTTAPPGWLLADGSVQDRAAYPSLFAAIGTTYNVSGETATQFRLPNMAGRVPIGVGTATGAAGATAHTIAQRGGEETHALTAAQTAVKGHGHSHTLGTGSDGVDHVHGVNYAGAGASTAYGMSLLSNAAVGGSTPAYNLMSTAANAGGASQYLHTHPINGSITAIADGADGAAHNTMPPYLCVNWLIRI